MKIHIKNMVCNRCRLVVGEIFTRFGSAPLSVELGEVTLQQEPEKDKMESIHSALVDLGFEILDDKRATTIEKVKNLIVKLVHQDNSELKINLSDYLSQNIGMDYNQLTGLFSEIEGTTIEKYYINQRVERVKELLVYNELSTSEIAHLMNYSSVAHLSNQFKKVTGLTPSYFKQFREGKRKALDEI